MRVEKFESHCQNGDSTRSKSHKGVAEKKKKELELPLLKKRNKKRRFEYCQAFLLLQIVDHPSNVDGSILVLENLENLGPVGGDAAWEEIGMKIAQ